MSERWRERYPEEVTCVRCLELRPKDELDRLLWCEECRGAARARARSWGWVAGLLAGVALGLWIVLVIEPSRELILGGWIATVVAAVYLGAKVAREIAYGAQRFRNRRAAEAIPPTARPGTDPPDATESGP